VVYRLPDFFVIGAAKSGTTSLHEHLDQHPDIHMSFPKELNFFSFLEEAPCFSGPQAGAHDAVLRDRLRREKYQMSVTTWRDYKRVFARTGAAKAIGESSVSYLYFPQAASRIRSFVPDARLIAILRNPVDRAYSKYRQLRRDGAEPLARFEDALAAEAIRMRENWSPAWFYVDRGFYQRQLKRYYEVFDRKAIYVVLYEEWARAQYNTLREICSFLGVDWSFPVDSSRRYNASDDMSSPRCMFLYALVARPNLLSRTTRAVLPKQVLAGLRPIVKRIVSKRRSEPESAPMSDETRRSLTSVFREDVLRLQDLIRKDLSSWL
jgi:hypothetical protein